MTKSINLGIIEGFFGRPWTWDERKKVVEILAPAGYEFFHYAPKADPFLRRRWMEPHPLVDANKIKSFAAFCKSLGVRFGVGLSPFEAFNDFNKGVQAAFVSRIEDLVSLGVQELGIFFDDMKSALPDLAQRQIEIAHLARDTAPRLKIIVTPSYYSDDPVLDRVFGQRPANYLADLGAGLDPKIGIYWTGEEVCAREISPGHLQKVAKLLGRKPILWDNYPVNDGPRMSQYLHLRGFTGRPARNAPLVAGHAINPASQALLSCIPALTLADSYRQGDAYCYCESADSAALRLGGPKLAEMLKADLLSFQDLGLSKLGDRKAAMISRYSTFKSAMAKEVVAWLSDEYAVTGEVVQTQ